MLTPPLKLLGGGPSPPPSSYVYALFRCSHDFSVEILIHGKKKQVHLHKLHAMAILILKFQGLQLE